MRAQPSWDPAAYARFGEQRSRPFADLLAQVRADDPGLVVADHHTALGVFGRHPNIIAGQLLRVFAHRDSCR